MIRLLVSALLVFGTAVVLAILQWTTPTYAVLTGPIETWGRQNETVLSRTFGVRVNNVTATKNISFVRYGKDVDRQTDGVFLIVNVDLEANKRTMVVTAAAIKGASGRIYRQTHRMSGAPQLLVDKQIQPGLTKSGIYIFEMPEQDMPNATLLVSEQLFPHLDSQIAVSLDTDLIENRARVEISP